MLVGYLRNMDSAEKFQASDEIEDGLKNVDTCNFWNPGQGNAKAKRKLNHYGRTTKRVCVLLNWILTLRLPIYQPIDRITFMSYLTNRDRVPHF